MNENGDQGWAAQSRLDLDGSALVANWQALARLSGDAATGAAVKADGYGLGAREVVRRLAKAGCRDFFVAHAAEAAAIADLVAPQSISILNGLLNEDIDQIRARGFRPVLNSLPQVRRWIEGGGGPCDLMIDSGMARLGLSPEQVAAPEVASLEIDTLMSHLGSAEEDTVRNARQLSVFRDICAQLPARRRSLANSAGIALGPDYRFDLTRPGLAIYGGIPVPSMAQHVRSVVSLSARVLQLRELNTGDAVGYGATFVAPHRMRSATLGIGYADGYLRGFSNSGSCRWHDIALPVLGRVSMDLLIVDAGNAEGLQEGDWVAVDYDLPTASRQSGLSQYELLTGLRHRSERRWTDS